MNKVVRHWGFCDVCLCHEAALVTPETDDWQVCKNCVPELCDMHNYDEQDEREDDEDLRLATEDGL